VFILFLSLLQTTVKTLRYETAEYMRQNPDDFLPFLSNKQGDMMTDEDFSNYCKDLETTAVWGGQPEVKERHPRAVFRLDRTIQLFPT